MAKRQNDVENAMLTTIIPLRKPEKTEYPTFTKCEGCSRPAVYEVYGQPHCREHMLEAIESKSYVEVRLLHGGFDDAS
ncbi:hypothetical protein [Paenibacillus urinalis]|uniref:hypothetical protein n=1 Tax=Paenibacillus urinalis TaxID=521520 RepID=UPI00195F2E06